MKTEKQNLFKRGAAVRWVGGKFEVWENHKPSRNGIIQMDADEIGIALVRFEGDSMVYACGIRNLQILKNTQVDVPPEHFGEPVLFFGER